MNVDRMQKMVEEFHRKHHALVSELPTLLSPEGREFRQRLISEEFKEYIEACEKGDIVGVYDGLTDLLYVVLGSFVSHGLDAEVGFAEVHRSNMTKDGDGLNCKPTKGPDFSPPDLVSLLRRQIEKGVSR